ncbi:uncharacterized protein P174DRAFT_498091 [Aspergillus novofumigatus IBT 16806]|uniref:Uncharacterized protein n=1 Tax=Aspergillus novofumigatus (strain IBT 16806) TaxID=1392255 RepID=A0A2I1BW86_ASPN1|nr:uncharacterized protein P174DRAFT_498091 [Aspergillus novofumigatus IBT 16806]PKX89642.1 hypothetical protein P174DRAFT_498091 [Aspergillus novofumigatus IBT 16806]
MASGYHRHPQPQPSILAWDERFSEGHDILRQRQAERKQFSWTAQSTSKDKIEADNSNAHLDATRATKATEDAQLKEVNPLDETLSDGPQEDVSIKAAKGATVKQALQAEMLDEDTDVIPDEIVTDDSNGCLEMTEEQLKEAVNGIDQVLSDDPQANAAVKSAKEAKVKRVLQVETDLLKTQMPSSEWTRRLWKRPWTFPYGVPFQGLSQKRSPENAVLGPSIQNKDATTQRRPHL